MSLPRIIDLSHGLGPETPTAASYPPVAIRILSAVSDRPADGSRSLNSSQITSGLHCGTHMDAPFHFFEDGPRIDQIPMEQCMGPAVLADLRQVRGGDEIREADLAPYADAVAELGKVVLNTGWHHRWGEPDYFTAFPVLSGVAAAFLVRCGAHLVGVDTPSLDHPPFEAHVALLGSGVWVVENLTNLDAIGTDPFQLVAFPLRISGREASPVRAVAITIQD